MLLQFASAEELIFQAKRDTASYLKELAAAGKVTYTFVSTGKFPCGALPISQGLFFDSTLPYLVVGINFKEDKAVIPGTGKELLSLTAREDIGCYVAAILKRPDIIENKIVGVAGDTQSADSLVGKYEKHLGTKFDVTYRSAEELDRIAQGLKSSNIGVYFSNRMPPFLRELGCLFLLLSLD